MSLDFFRDDGVFLPMLNDTGRNKFYQQALLETAAGKTVCDIGAGTGLLSILAVQAGAEHVIAVEKNVERYNYLNHILEQTGYKSKIQTVNADFLDTDIAADVYVTETINTQMFGEGILALSNHVVGRGQFIPGYIKMWIEAYQEHPIFTLDLSRSEAYEFDPDITIDKKFADQINHDVNQQYNLQDTVYRANQLNRLFTMLPNFTDVKLEMLYTGDPVIIDLGQYNDQNNIVLSIPNQYNVRNIMLVVKWQLISGDAVLSSDQCWFGNIAKLVVPKFKTKDTIEFRYDPTILDWRLDY